MGRKKRKALELKPFCFYCDREFDDVKVLIQHQKAKHFKCLSCNRKLDTAAGLVVHMLQVHKEPINTVPNALSGRDNPDVVVHGMEGIPGPMLEERKKKLVDAMGDRKAKRQERVSWTQVAMAPQNLEQFMQQAQQGILPKFLPPLPQMPGAPGGQAASMMLPGLGFPPLFPGMGGAAAAPQLLPGGQVGRPFALQSPQVMGMPRVAQTTSPAGGGGPVGVINTNDAGGAVAPPGGVVAGAATTTPGDLGLQQPRRRGFADGPPTGAAVMMPSAQNAMAAAGGGGGAVGDAAAAAAAAAAAGASPIGPLPPPGTAAGGGGMPPQLPPPPAPGAPPLPANVRLMYDDDAFSMEEKKAMAFFGIRIAA